MPIFAVHYTYIDDPDRVQRHRPDHRAYLQTLDGELLACGPLVEPPPAGGLLIFDVDSYYRMQEIVENDPFKTSGVLRDHSVQTWSLFIGAERFQQ
jgi:uncharacterized protein